MTVQKVFFVIEVDVQDSMKNREAVAVRVNMALNLARRDLEASSLFKSIKLAVVSKQADMQAMVAARQPNPKEQGEGIAATAAKPVDNSTWGPSAEDLLCADADYNTGHG